MDQCIPVTLLENTTYVLSNKENCILQTKKNLPNKLGGKNDDQVQIHSRQIKMY